MFLTIWTYQVNPDKHKEFIEYYAADGEWAKLFSTFEGFLGTTLAKNDTSEFRYVTIDNWATREDFIRMRIACKAEYEKLGAMSDHLTYQEVHLGFYSEQNTVSKICLS